MGWVHVGKRNETILLVSLAMSQGVFTSCGYTSHFKGCFALTVVFLAIISELGSDGWARKKTLPLSPPSASAQTQVQGLGASFITNTGACLDKDGDGYGVGPACLGPDADDNDAAVHSASDVVAKYGSVDAFLIHLGYRSATSPSTVWCISPSGNNVTGASNKNADAACTKPFLNWQGVNSHLVTPYIVIFRAGIYGQQIYLPPGGTSSSQNVIMQYPGELAVVDGSQFSYGVAFKLDGISYVTVDGFKVINVDSGAAYAGGTYCPLPCSGSIKFVGDILRHMEGQSGGEDSNVDADNIQNFLLEENVFHDPDTSVGQHNVYLGSNSLASSNVTVRRNILYDDKTGYPSFQFNGRVTNLILSQNLIYNSAGVGIAFLQGVSNSLVESNLVFNSAYEALKIFDYESGQCNVKGLPSICPYDQTGNLIENNTFWVGTTSTYTANGKTNAVFTPPGSGQLGGITYGAINVQNATTSASCGSTPLPCGNLGGNTFRNNIVVGSGPRLPGGSYPPIIFTLKSPNYLSTSTFTNNVIWAQDGSSGDNFVVGFGPGPSFGYQGYTCTQFAALAIVTNCINADPLFVSASPKFFNTPASFNFHLQPASPAIGKGASVGLPLLDLTGDGWNSPPSIGALEAVSILTPQRIASTLTATGQVGTPFSYSISENNAPTRFATSPLPAGLTVNPATGVITGTPLATGTTSVTLSATNVVGTNQTAILTLTIVAQPPPGWTDLGSTTQMQNVCPPKDANGNSYNFPFYCANDVRAWSGGIADTKRNRLIVWGGGHVDSSDNSVYSLSLSANPPAMTRIWGPGSQVYPNCANEPGLNGVDPSALSDGSPNSRHTWYNLTYIPTADAMFSFSGGLANCGWHTNDTWLLNMSTLKWTQMDPVNGFNPYTGSSTTSSSTFYAVADYDPNTDAVFVAWSNTALLQYNWRTNTYSLLSRNTIYPYSAGGVIDSKRKRFWFFGSNYQSTTLIAGYVNLTGSDSYVFHDVTSSTRGCSGISPSSRPSDGAYPGLAYVPTMDKIVAWPIWGGNTVYVFDPATLACSTQTFPGGPTNTKATGVFGRWRYFPALNEFAVVSDSNQDSYVFKLP